MDQNVSAFFLNNKAFSKKNKFFSDFPAFPPELIKLSTSVAGEKGGGRSAATRFVLTLRELTPGGRSVSTLLQIGGNFTQKLDEMGDFCKLRNK